MAGRDTQFGGVKSRVHGWRPQKFRLADENMENHLQNQHQEARPSWSFLRQGASNPLQISLGKRRRCSDAEKSRILPGQFCL